MLIVDRIEDRVAVCERLDGVYIDVPVSMLTPPVSEGDVLCFSQDGLFCRDEAATRARKAQAEALLDGIFS